MSFGKKFVTLQVTTKMSKLANWSLEEKTEFPILCFRLFSGIAAPTWQLTFWRFYQNHGTLLRFNAVNRGMSVVSFCFLRRLEQPLSWMCICNFRVLTKMRKAKMQWTWPRMVHLLQFSEDWNNSQCKQKCPGTLRKWTSRCHWRLWPWVFCLEILQKGRLKMDKCLRWHSLAIPTSTSKDEGRTPTERIPYTCETGLECVKSCAVYWDSKLTSNSQRFYGTKVRRNIRWLPLSLDVLGKRRIRKEYFVRITEGKNWAICSWAAGSENQEHKGIFRPRTRRVLQRIPAFPHKTRQWNVFTLKTRCICACMPYVKAKTENGAWCEIAKYPE